MLKLIRVLNNSPVSHFKKYLRRNLCNQEQSFWDAWLSYCMLHILFLEVVTTTSLVTIHHPTVGPLHQFHSYRIILKSYILHFKWIEIDMNSEIQASLDTIRNMLQYHRSKAVNPRSHMQQQESALNRSGHTTHLVSDSFKFQLS